MERFDKSSEVLRDLLLIQYDRKAAYERVLRWPDHSDTIHQHLKKMVSQSRNCILEFRRHIDVTFSDPADRADRKGELYHEWKGIQYFVPGNGTQEIMEVMERNEMEVLLAYQRAMEPGKVTGDNYRELIGEQIKMLFQSIEYIQEVKEKPVEMAVLNEEDKPFVFLHSRVFTENNHQPRAVDHLE